MGVRYTVQADVFDITRTSSSSTDCFLVDSNIWFWMTYSHAGHGEPGWRTALMNQYATFVQEAFGKGVRLLVCGLSLAELSHTIERTEREIHELKCSIHVNAKEYRHNSDIQRMGVVKEIKAAWDQVSSLAECLMVNIDTLTTMAALDRLQTEKVDGYDLFILETMKKHGVMQIITDDGDFSTVPGLQVFTVNRKVIQSARVQGRLAFR